MQKDIALTGLTTTPSSHECNDGDIAACINLIPEDGALKPLHQPFAIGTIGKGEKLWVHETPDFIHYIKRDADGKWWWAESEDKSPDIPANKWQELKGIDGEELNDLAYNGNTVVVAMKGMPVQYVIWNGDQYKVLGKLPKVEMEFALEGDVKYMPISNAVQVVSGRSIVDDFGQEEPLVLYTATEADNDGYTLGVVWYKCRVKLTKETFSKLEDGKEYFIKNIDCSYLRLGVSYGTGNTVYPLSSGSIGKGEGAYFRCEEGRAVWAYIKEPEGQIAIYEVSRGEEVGEETSGAYVVNSAENYANILGAISKFGRSYGEEGGKFVHPFLVRYGIQMMDGSVVNMSAPMLMQPNTGNVPLFLVREIGIEENDYMTAVTLAAFACDLKYKVMKTEGIESWKEYVKGIVIGISSPMAIYRQDETYNATKFTSSLLQSATIANSSLQDTKIDMEIESIANYPLGIMYPPRYNADEYERKVRNNGVFYEATLLTTDEVKKDDEYHTLKLKDINPMFPEVGRLMEESNVNADMEAEKVTVYNSRVHLCNVKEQVSMDGIALSPVLPSTNAYMIEAVIKKNGKTYSITTDWKKGNVEYAKYVYANDPDVTKVIIHKEKAGEAYRKSEIDLEYHGTMAGMYKYKGDGFAYDIESDNNKPQEKTDYPTISHANEIFVSKADNPFVYPAENAVQCGRGAIRNIAVNTETVSEGQFGDAPLYVFTDEETWILSVDSQGRYAAKQPLQNSVCINPEEVTTLSNGTIYTTVNGIMLAEGKRVTCISDSLRDQVSKYTLKHLGKIMTATDNIDKGDYLPDYMYDENWLTFLKTCGIAHDRVNERVIVYPKDSDLAFVYSLRSGLWGMMRCNIIGKIGKANASWVLIDDGTNDGSAGAKPVRPFEPIDENKPKRKITVWLSDDGMTLYVMPDGEIHHELRLRFLGIEESGKNPELFVTIEAGTMDTVSQAVAKKLTGVTIIGLQWWYEYDGTDELGFEFIYGNPSEGGTDDDTPEEGGGESEDIEEIIPPSDDDDEGEQEDAKPSYIIADISNPEFAKDKEKTFQSQYVITRPIGLDAPDVMKRVKAMIARGYFRKKSIGSALYGSRDLFNWHLIATSKDKYVRCISGTPYKYFIAVMAGSLEGDESIQGLSFDYDASITNQLR